MDSRRHFLRGLARAATGGGRPAASTASPAVSSPSATDEGHGSDAAPAPPTSADADIPSRYATALGDPGWGSAAQEALGRSGVLIIGAGALGTPVLGYLAAAGVGRLGVLDGAEVALTDLRGETIHYTPDVGVPKAHSAAVKLGFLNPEIVVEPYQVRLDRGNVDGLLSGQDLVVDCSNEGETRAVVAEAGARLGIALVAASAGADGGWVITVPAGEHACARCAGAREAAWSGSPAGAEAGVIGALQAREALKRLPAVDEPPEASVLHVDLGTPALRRVPLVRRADCPICACR